MDRDSNEPKARFTPGRLLLGLGGIVIVALVALYMPAVRDSSGPSDPGDSGTPNGDADTLAVSREGEPARRTIEHTSDPDAVSVEPGVVDVQEYQWLEQDLQRLLKRTDRDARDRMTPDEFRVAFTKATVEYLKLDGAETERFELGVESALKEVRRAREDLAHAQSEIDPAVGWEANDTEAAERQRAAWSEFRVQQAQAGVLLASALERRPRTQLLYEESLKWILRLDYGMRGAARP